MRKNPFLKMDEKIIRKIYGNKATLLIIKINRVYDESTGEIAEKVNSFDREIYISNPKLFADYFIDGQNVMRGDVTVEIARQTLLEAVGDLRPDSLMNGKLDPEHDWIVFGNKAYTIRKIEPKNIYANTPGVYQVHLREAGYAGKT